MITQFRHIGLLTKSLGSMILYYGLGLGFNFLSEEVVNWRDALDLIGHGGTFKAYKIVNSERNVVIEFYQFNKNISVDVGAFNSFTHISLTVKDINEVWAKLKDFEENWDNLGNVVSKKICKRHGHYLFFARDPEGNLIEFVQPTLITKVKNEIRRKN